MDRRTFIKGAVVAAATPGVVSSADSVEHSTLLALIAKHGNLYTADDQAWGRVFNLDDSEAMRSAPRTSVQVSRLLVGRTVEGENIFQPIIAHSESEITAYFDDHLQHIDMMTGSSIPAWREARLKAHNDRRQAKLDEFRACREARKRHEDQCGYTAAMEAAQATMREVKSVEALIIKYIPATLEEAAIKARWLVKKMNDDRSYLNDYEAALEEALDAIGRAQHPVN